MAMMAFSRRCAPSRIVGISQAEARHGYLIITYMNYGRPDARRALMECSPVMMIITDYISIDDKRFFGRFRCFFRSLFSSLEVSKKGRYLLLCIGQASPLIAIYSHACHARVDASTRPLMRYRRRATMHIASFPRRAFHITRDGA